MKIFVLPSWYKSKKYPENCIFIYEQIASLSRLGHQIVVLHPEMRLYPCFHQKITKENDNVSIIYCQKYWAGWPSHFPFFNIYNFQKCATSLFETAIQQQGIPDVIYAHFSIPAGLVATRIGNKYNIPVVVEEHYSGIMQGNMSKHSLQLIDETINNCHSFICVSFGLKKAMKQQIGKKTNIKVISNMINPCFRYTPPINGYFTFLSIGGLIPRKGFDFLIRCFSDIFKGTNVQLKIVGSGNQKDKIERLITNNNMQNQIHLLGQLSREETLRQYQECQCFVLTSQAETFGLVYREAMAVGRPIISTRHGGFSSEDWHNEFGELINYGDVEALKGAFLNIYQNYKKYNYKRISELCLSTCDENVVIKQIEFELQSASKTKKMELNV